MRALFLTCHLPFPPISGGRLREHELLRRVCGEVEVHVCAVSKTYEEDLAAADELRGRCASVSVFPAQPGPASLPEQVRRHCSPEAALQVRRLLRRVDVAHVEGYYLARLVPARSPVPLLLVEQNVEYGLWAQRVALAEREEAKRQAFREFRLARAHEVAVWRRADLCAAVTEDDRAEMRRVARELDVRLVPDGVDHLGGPPAPPARQRSEVVLVGNFAYQPNVDAASWLCREILPRVRERVPETRALLVGNAPPPEVAALGCEHVEVTGRVRQVEPYLDRAAVVVSPLRVGGGIKVKVLEALCRGKAIVSTSVGVQGLGAAAHEAIEVADDADAFAAATAHLLVDEAARRRLERRARALADTLPTWDDAGAELLECYRYLAAVPALADAKSAELR